MQWKLETRKLKDLSEFTKNPRRISKEQALHLERSIKNFGQCQPLVINSDGLIIGGHQRYRVMKRLKFKEAQVYVPERELSDKQLHELNIRLNKNTGYWDDDILANIWELDDLFEWGFTEKELGIAEKIENSEETDGNSAENRKNPAKMTITFENSDDLQQAENRIATIIDEFEGARYKIKV